MKEEIDELKNKKARKGEKLRKAHKISSFKRSISEKELPILLDEERLGKERTKEIEKVRENLNEMKEKEKDMRLRNAQSSLKRKFNFDQIV